MSDAVMVPREPTEAMLHAFHVALDRWMTGAGEDGDVWKAMIDAAPALAASTPVGGLGSRPQEAVPGEPVSGHDRHLLDSLLSNYMRVTVVREDTHDAVTLWNEAGDPIAHGTAPSTSPLHAACGFAASEGSSAPGGRVDEAPQSIEQIIAPVATGMGQPVYSLDDAVSAIRTASALLDPPADQATPKPADGCSSNEGAK